jgi:hypothetical protein
MFKSLFPSFLLLLSSSLFATHHESVLGEEGKKTLANQLLFYFASSDVVLSKNELQMQLKNDKKVTGRIYSRIINQRKKTAETNSFIGQTEALKEKRLYSFSRIEIRRAAYEEMMLLGPDIQDLLIESIFSQQDSIRLWVLRCLANYHNEKVALAFSNVIVEGKSVGKGFSMLCKREVAKNLINYLEFEVAKKLFKTCLKDEMNQVRSALLDSIVVNESNKDFIYQSLMQLYNNEVKMIEQKVREYRLLNVTEVLNRQPILATPLINCLEVIFTRAPQVFQKIVLKEELLNHSSLKYVLIKNSKFLKSEDRIKLLKHHLSQKDILTKTIVIKSLSENDEKLFIKEIANILEEQKNDTLLYTTLSLAQKWKSKELVKSIEVLVKKIDDYRKVSNDSGYREKMRGKALKIVSAI